MIVRTKTTGRISTLCLRITSPIVLVLIGLYSTTIRRVAVVFSLLLQKRIVGTTSGNIEVFSVLLSLGSLLLKSSIGEGSWHSPTGNTMWSQMSAFFS